MAIHSLYVVLYYSILNSPQIELYRRLKDKVFYRKCVHFSVLYIGMYVLGLMSRQQT
jgi:hypothetical protein